MCLPHTQPLGLDPDLSYHKAAQSDNNKNAQTSSTQAAAAF